MAREIDLAVAWEWPFDADFVDRLLAAAAGRGWRTLAIMEANLGSVRHDLAEGRLRLGCFLDRATDVRPEFAPLTPLAERSGTRVINHAYYQGKACEKARSHLLCASQGIALPYTVIVPPFISDPSPPRLPAALGRPFVAKPGSGGGGLGVILDVASTQDVQNARRTFWRERYLLQRRVVPRHLEGRRAWFRAFYVCGRVVLCWWDDQSHLYTPLAPDAETRLGLTGIRQALHKISRVVALDFFTTELALGCDGRLVCIDYANSPCDMRVQSQHRDGVPDQVVDQIIDALLAQLEPWPAPASAWQALPRQ